MTNLFTRSNHLNCGYLYFILYFWGKIFKQDFDNNLYTRSSIKSLISLQCIDNTVRFLFQRFLLLLLLLRCFLGVFLVERVYIYGGTRVSLVEEGFLDVWTVARVTIIAATVTQFGYTQVI